MELSEIGLLCEPVTPPYGEPASPERPEANRGANGSGIIGESFYNFLQSETASSFYGPSTGKSVSFGSAGNFVPSQSYKDHYKEVELCSNFPNPREISRVLHGGAEGCKDGLDAEGSLCKYVGRDDLNLDGGFRFPPHRDIPVTDGNKNLEAMDTKDLCNDLFSDNADAESIEKGENSLLHNFEISSCEKTETTTCYNLTLDELNHRQPEGMHPRHFGSTPFICHPHDFYEMNNPRHTWHRDERPSSLSYFSRSRSRPIADLREIIDDSRQRGHFGRGGHRRLPPSGHHSRAGIPSGRDQYYRGEQEFPCPPVSRGRDFREELRPNPPWVRPRGNDFPESLRPDGLLVSIRQERNLRDEHRRVFLTDRRSRKGPSRSRSGSFGSGDRGRKDSPSEPRHGKRSEVVEEVGRNGDREIVVVVTGEDSNMEDKSLTELEERRRTLMEACYSSLYEEEEGGGGCPEEPAGCGSSSNSGSGASASKKRRRIASDGEERRRSRKKKKKQKRHRREIVEDWNGTLVNMAEAKGDDVGLPPGRECPGGSGSEESDAVEEEEGVLRIDTEGEDEVEVGPTSEPPGSDGAQTEDEESPCARRVFVEVKDDDREEEEEEVEEEEVAREDVQEAEDVSDDQAKRSSWAGSVISRGEEGESDDKKSEEENGDDSCHCEGRLRDESRSPGDPNGGGVQGEVDGDCSGEEDDDASVRAIPDSDERNSPISCTSDVGSPRVEEDEDQEARVEGVRGGSPPTDHGGSREESRHEDRYSPGDDDDNIYDETKEEEEKKERGDGEEEEEEELRYSPTDEPCDQTNEDPNLEDLYSYSPTENDRLLRSRRSEPGRALLPSSSDCIPGLSPGSSPQGAYSPSSRPPSVLGDVSPISPASPARCITPPGRTDLPDLMQLLLQTLGSHKIAGNSCSLSSSSSTGGGDLLQQLLSRVQTACGPAPGRPAPPPAASQNGLMAFSTNPLLSLPFVLQSQKSISPSILHYLSLQSLSANHPGRGLFGDVERQSARDDQGPRASYSPFDVNAVSPRSEDAMSFSPPSVAEDKRNGSNGTGGGGGTNPSDRRVHDEASRSASLEKRVKATSRMELQQKLVCDIKEVLRPVYKRGKIDKEDYKDILRKTVPKILNSSRLSYNRDKITKFIEAYIQKVIATKKYYSRKVANLT